MSSSFATASGPTIERRVFATSGPIQSYWWMAIHSAAPDPKAAASAITAARANLLFGRLGLRERGGRLLVVAVRLSIEGRKAGQFCRPSAALSGFFASRAGSRKPSAAAEAGETPPLL